MVLSRAKSVSEPSCVVRTVRGSGWVLALIETALSIDVHQFGNRPALPIDYVV